MFRYRLHSPDGDDLGKATYAMMIKPGLMRTAGEPSWRFPGRNEAP